MPVVDIHPVRAHRELDLVHRGPARGLDAQHLLHLHHVRRAGALPAHTFDAHHCLQSKPFDEQPVRATVVDAVRELADENRLLTDEVRRLEARNVRLESRLDALEKVVGLID